MQKLICGKDLDLVSWSSAIPESERVEHDFKHICANSPQRAMSVEKLSRDVWAHHIETKSCICHICGFEKSGNFEESCICGSVPAVDSSVGIKRPAISFRAGGHPAKRSCFMENGMKKTDAKFESHPSNSDKLKAMGQAPDLEPREGNAGKPSEGAGHTRRLNDTPAVVPIKKRRIQIMKTPSPPPRSPSPLTPLSRASSPQGVSSAARSPASGQTPSSAASISPLLGYSSVSSPRSAEPVPMSLSKARALLQPALHLQPLACSASDLGGATASSCDNAQALDTKALSMSSTDGDVDASMGGENEQRPTLVDESCNNNYDITRPNISCGGLEESIGHHSQNDQNRSADKQEGELQRSESSSFSRDDRLHWDLNTDMAAWDASTEQVSDKGTDEQAAETPLRSLSANSAETSPDHGAMGCEHDPRMEGVEEPESGDEEMHEKEEPDTQRGAVKVQPTVREEVVEEVPEVAEETEDDLGTGEETVEEEPEDNMEQSTPAVFEHTKADSPEKEQAGPPPGQVESVWTGQDAADLPESAKPDAIDLPEPGRHRPSDTDLSSDGGNAAEPSENQCHEDDIPVKYYPKAGKQAKSISDDAEGWNYASEEPEFEEHLDYGDSDFRDPDDVGLEADDRISLMQEESNWKVEDGAYPGGSFRRTSQECDTSSADAVVAKASSCDGQPLEQSPERHTLPGRSRTTGWDKLPEGFDNAEEALKAAKEVSARRGTRGGGPWTNLAGRGSSSLSSHSASRFGPGPGPGPARNAVREGFSSARGDGYYGDRHPDEMMYDRDGYRHGRRPDDSFGAHNVVRGRDPVRRPGVFGRGRGGGWIDSQSGHMNQWGPSRHRPSSGFGGSSNAASVAAARVEHSGFMVAPDGTLTKPGGGMGPGRGGLRSTVSGGRGGRGGHVQVGRGPPGDMDGGVHYPLRAGIRGDRATGGMNTGGRGLGGNSGPGYGNGMHDRAGRGPIERYRGGIMESRRSESPRRPYPLDHLNMMGRMPGMRADSRVMRSRTPPPSHRSVGHADFGASRSQRSPPPPSRWSCDKREVDYQDREFKRPVSRPRVPPQRTSPHVVHGSSLTDERDRQVLAGSRQSPVKGPVNSSLRNSRDDGLEARLPKRSEEEDIRHTGPFPKEGDYRRSSPMRDSDRERDRGGLYRRDRDRDREDDRRRDFRRSTSRDGRFSSGPKYAASREADDDVAPRRRRPS